MRLEKIRVENFRCFEDTGEIVFDKNLNVFVGINASGKTAFLEAIKYGVAAIFEKLWFEEYRYEGTYSIDKKKDPRIINFNDEVWTTANEVRIVVDGSFYNSQTREFSPAKVWERKIIKRNRNYGRPLTKGIDKEVQNFNEIIAENRNEELPVICFFSTARAYVEGKKTTFSFDGKRANGYIKSLDNKNSFNLFTEWFGQEHYKRYAEREENKISLLNGFDIVKNILISFIPEVDDIIYKPHKKYRSGEIIFVLKNGIAIPANSLSDGYWNLLLIASDIAVRCYNLNPYLGKKANETHGIVMIDEVDLHLHPKWQRIVIENLTTTFPNIQFFITTHSPQVISTVDKENVFILKDYKISKIDTYVKGRDTNSILEELFGVSERPEEYKEKLSLFYFSLEKNNIETAKLILNELKSKWGDMDTEIFRANMYYEDAIGDNNEIHNKE